MVRVNSDTTTDASRHALSHSKPSSTADRSTDAGSYTLSVATCSEHGPADAAAADHIRRR
jgi:hypothetical protein